MVKHPTSETRLEKECAYTRHLRRPCFFVRFGPSERNVVTRVSVRSIPSRIGSCRYR